MRWKQEAQIKFDLLRVMLTQDRFGKPLAVLDLPGLGTELRPDQLRKLAVTLMFVADDCEERLATGEAPIKGFATREYHIDAEISGQAK